MKEQFLIIIVGSLLLDFLLGDPHGLWHPVMGIGWLIQQTEKILRKIFKPGKWKERVAGILLWFVVCGLTFGVSLGIWLLARRLHPVLGTLILILYGYQVLAAKSLKLESMKVYYALKMTVSQENQKDLNPARTALSMIVGRDTKNLTKTEIVKAAVETVAENTSDGVIAPLFYTCIFGPIGGMLYKAMNTMDSMIGYRTEKYQYFGTFAARMDDVVNWIPARLAAIFMLMVAIPTKYSVKKGWKIFLRDRYHHGSPNSAQTESVMAGLLGIQLGGDAYYFGELHKKQTMGDSLRDPIVEDIKQANRLMYGTTILAAFIFVLVRIGIILWFRI